MDWTKTKTVTIEELIDFLKSTKYKGKTLYDYLCIEGRLVEAILLLGKGFYDNYNQGRVEPNVQDIFARAYCEYIYSFLTYNKIRATEFTRTVADILDEMRRFCEENEEQNFLDWYIKTE
jgi:hypothetical protein